MPVRIYALAKDLNLDSKELVEACRKAGITGKGSALASLSDDEAVKLKAYLEAGQKKAESAADGGGGGAATRFQDSSAYTRDDYIAPRRPEKIKVLDVRSRKASTPRAAEEQPVDETADRQPDASAPAALPPDTPAPVAPPSETPAPDSPADVTATPDVEASEPEVAGEIESSPAEEPVEGSPKPVAPLSRAAREEKPPEKPPQTPESRPEPIPLAATPPRPDTSAPVPIRPPLAEPRKPMALDQLKKPAQGRKTRKKREPVINLAALPEVKQPAPKPQAPPPKAQQPEIRLPKSAITGNKAPLADLTKSLEQKAEKAASKKRHGKQAASEVVDDEAAAAKGGKRRRPAAPVDDDSPKRGLTGIASSRAERQKSRKNRARTRTGGEEEQTAPTRRPRRLKRTKGVNTAAPRKENVTLVLPCTIRSFSEATGVPAGQVLKTLMGFGITTMNINTLIDNEAVEMLVTELGVEVEFRQPETLEERLIDQLEDQVDDESQLEPRPPVVTFLGHVDHGKTSLLDHIIGIDVVSGEAGGITQHIRAYEIDKGGRRIAFVDTPGHEAFTEMRARGANVTDIAVLVVAADDGIMPQTEEAISHAKAAGVPIIVALNKMDLPGADANRALQQLTAQELLPSEWGGDVEVIRTSATTGEGLDDLLETILVTAELHEYKANANRPAVGVCLEAEQESGRGVVVKVIVKNGTLHVGDVVVCGATYGRVKAMYDTLKPRMRVESAGPSTPVNLTGFEEAPEAGEKFYVLDDISQAREIAAQRATATRAQSLSGITTRVSFEEFQRRLAEGSLVDSKDMVTLNLILRADVRGSIEAIEKELSKIQHPEVEVRILHKSVGAITPADITLADASDAVVIGFNVIPDEAARSQADSKQVEIRRYDIIYKVTDDIKALLEGRLKPEEKTVELGHALVKRVFPISRVGTVAGCYVVQGSINRGCRIRVNRDGRTIGDYELDSLRREKDDVKEVSRGLECGIKLNGFNDIKQDDILEAYKIEEVARTL